MSKPRGGQYVCQECGAESQRWHGKCFSCGAWNSLVEVPQTISGSTTTSTFTQSAKLQQLSSVNPNTHERVTTTMEGMDKVLGGGLVPGAVILLGGEPGSGKSTLLLQYADTLAKDRIVYYFTGEETAEQVALRSQRLQLKHTQQVHIAPVTHVEEVINTLTEQSTAQAPVVIIDSVQTISSVSVVSKQGSVGQVQAVVQTAVQYAKQHNIPFILVGHVTKEGNLAGPKTAEHLVDVVLYLEGDTERKVVRSVKNRFGSVNEIAFYDFTEGSFKDLIPSFLSEEAAKRPAQVGSVASMVKEGGHFVPVEIQALVTKSYMQNPRRVVNGYDYNRVLQLIAVLERYTKYKFYQHDVFINVSEGIRVFETAPDVAICIALLSSLKNIPIPSDVIAWGEISLLGTIVSVSNEAQRGKESTQYGFNTRVTADSYKKIANVLQWLTTLATS